MPISKSNRRGLTWLVLIGLIISYSPRVLSKLSSSGPPIITFEEAKQIEIEILNELKETEKSSFQKKYHSPKTKFNPNNYTVSDWMKLGLSEKQAKSIVKYSTYGIRSNEDLKKIYVLPGELYELIKDSTMYPEENNKSHIEHVEHVQKVIDLNRASYDDLLALPGIGPFYTEKIIERRNKLGGFVNTEQLLELWKFDDVKYNRIIDLIQVDPSGITKLSVNRATLSELKQHPYISYAVANSIVKMRAQKEFLSVEDILRSKLIDEELLNKLKPYLEL